MTTEGAEFSVQCSICHAVIVADEHGPIVRIQEHYRRQHPGKNRLRFYF